MFLQFCYFWALCHHWATHMVSILCCLAGHLMFFLALVLAAHIQSWSNAHLVKPIGLLVKGGWSLTSWWFSTTKSFRKSAFWSRDIHRIGEICSRILGAIRLSWWSCSQFTRMVSKTKALRSSGIGFAKHVHWPGPLGSFFGLTATFLSLYVSEVHTGQFIWLVYTAIEF